MMSKTLPVLLFALSLSLFGAACSENSSNSGPDGDASLDGDREIGAESEGTDDDGMETDSDSDGIPGEVETSESEEEAGWSYRDPWNAPVESWSTCPETLYRKGITLRDKAAYYDWIVPALHQVPRWTAGHESYSRVFKIDCEGEIPTTIVEDEHLPFCRHALSENNGLWTSLYVASQAFRYAATGDPEALEQLRRTLNGTYQQLLITGKPGLYARDFRDPALPEQYCIEAEEPYASSADDNVKYSRYIPPDDHMVGNSFVKIDTDGCFLTWDPTLNGGSGGWAKDSEHCTDPRFSGFCWQRNASKDEYSGHMFAAGIVAKLIDDPEIHQMAVEILTQVGRHLADHDFWVNDYDGRNTRYGSVRAMALDEIPGFNALLALGWSKEAAVVSGNPELESVYADCLLQLSGKQRCLSETPHDYRTYLDVMGLALGCNTNYDNISIASLAYFNLIWFEQDAALRSFYREMFHLNTRGPDADGRDFWSEGDPFKNFILVSLMEPEGYVADDAKKLVEEAVCTLKRFHTDNRYQAQDNTDLPEWCVSPRHGSLAESPIPIEKRCSSIFEWWGDPNERDVCGENVQTAEPPAGFLLPYWMGRYFGFIGADL